MTDEANQHVSQSPEAYHVDILDVNRWKKCVLVRWPDGSVEWIPTPRRISVRPAFTVASVQQTSEFEAISAGDKPPLPRGSKWASQR